MTVYIDNIMDSPIFINILCVCGLIFVGLVWLCACVLIIGAIVVLVKHVNGFKPEGGSCPDPNCRDIFCDCGFNKMEKGEVVLKTTGFKNERF